MTPLAWPLQLDAENLERERPRLAALLSLDDNETMVRLITLRRALDLGRDLGWWGEYRWLRRLLWLRYAVDQGERGGDDLYADPETSHG